MKIIIEIPDKTKGAAVGWWSIHRLRDHAKELREMPDMLQICDEIETAADILESVMRYQRGDHFDNWVHKERIRNGQLEHEIRARAASLPARAWSWLTNGAIEAHTRQLIDATGDTTERASRYRQALKTLKGDRGHD